MGEEAKDENGYIIATGERSACAVKSLRPHRLPGAVAHICVRYMQYAPRLLCGEVFIEVVHVQQWEDKNCTLGCWLRESVLWPSLGP